jgi:hypothetical protein
MPIAHSGGVDVHSSNCNLFTIRIALEVPASAAAERGPCRERILHELEVLQRPLVTLAKIAKARSLTSRGRWIYR